MVDEAVHGLYSYLQLQKRFSTLTISANKTDLYHLQEFLSGELKAPSLLTVTHHRIRRFLAQLMLEIHAAATVNRKLSSIRSLYRWLLKTGQITNNPAQKVTGPK